MTAAIFEAVFFIASLGVLFGERFKENRHPARVAAGVIAVISTLLFAIQNVGAVVRLFSHPSLGETQVNSAIVQQTSTAQLPPSQNASTAPSTNEVAAQSAAVPTAGSPAETASPPAEPAVQQQAPAQDPVVAPTTTSPSKELGRSVERNGVYVVLNAAGENESRYVVGLTVVNDNPSDIGVGLLSSRVFTAEAYITDADGDSCQLAQNGEGWGSLSAFLPGSANFGAQYSQVPANDSRRETLFFNKGRCGGSVIKKDGVSVNMTLLISQGGTIFQYPISFNSGT